MTAKQKRMRTRILAAAALFAAVLLLDKLALPESVPALVRLALYLVPYSVAGYDVVRKAALNIAHGQAFDESFLMTLATVAAFAVGEYGEAVAVMVFYQTGELFQGVAVGRARASIGDLMSIAPEYANLETEDGVEEVDPEDVPVGGVIVVKAGERVPLDGVVLAGESFLDTRALTGESVPRRASVGDEVFSGCVNGQGTLRVRTTKAYEDSTVARILELVENASEKKARLEQFITRFARVYTPAVTIAALLLAVAPPLLLHQPFGGWIRRACTFLIVSCPCALVVSVPLGFFGGIGAASRIGVLVKGGNYLEALAAVDTVAFDKTGTLTRGTFTVTELLSAPGVTEAELLEAAAHAEAFSTHPIALSIREAYAAAPDTARLSEAVELPGRGVRALLDGAPLLSGSGKLLEEHAIAYAPCGAAGTHVHVALDGRYLGCLVISDAVKDGAAEAVAALKAAGVRRTVMLTGDRAETANAVASALGVDEVHAELLPADKVAQVERLLDARSERGRLCFAGDGINDAPVLMRADVGVAMGSLGSDAAIEAADVVLMDDDLRKLAVTMRIARKTVRIVRENVAGALAAKFVILVLGALGVASMWAAVFGDVGVLILAVLNSMRCLKINS